jgi:ATP-dependent DNA helicase RecQ
LDAPGREPSPERVEDARRHARGLDVVIEPRKLWPSGLEQGLWHALDSDGAGRGRKALKGRIVGAAEGRALAYADDAGWAEALRSAFQASPAVAGPELLQGLVQLLGRWKRDWPARPVAVVPMPSREHANLVNAVAAHLAAVGRLPVVDALERVDDEPHSEAPADADAELASRPRVDALLQVLRLREGVAVPAGPLLLVDARYRSGWSVTVAASLLRAAGATAVLPLVVHQLP